jgi:hypothetical protein
MRRMIRTGKSENNDEIQGSFTGPAAGPPFRMTTENNNREKLSTTVFKQALRLPFCVVLRLHTHNSGRGTALQPPELVN